MKNQKLILSVIIIVVVSVVLILLERRTPFESGSGAPMFAGLNERAITAIVVNGSVGAPFVRLERTTGGEWVIVQEIAEFDSAGEVSNVNINRIEADESLVATAITNLLALRKNELVSNNPANQANFGLDSAHSGASIEIYTTSADDFAYKLLLGRSGSSWNTIHVRMSDSNELYLVPADITQSMQPNIDFWKRPPPAEDPFAESIPLDGDALQYIDELQEQRDAALVSD